MMSLVLFCGGDPIYPGGVPKPLQEVSEGRTLLELYLDTIDRAQYREIVVLCENQFSTEFRNVAARIHAEDQLAVQTTQDGSTTLMKLREYLDGGRHGDAPSIWTYPDIFYFGPLTPRCDTKWSEEVVISLRPVASRFPRIVMDPFLLKVRSISRRESKVPANAAHLFGGHLIASPRLLSNVLSEGLDRGRGEEPSLEFDVFARMIGRGLVNALPLEDSWLKADGPRDLRDILAMVERVRSIQSNA